MYKKEEMDQKLLMTAATVEKESMVLLNLDLLHIKSSQKDKRLFPDHMVEFCVQVALNPESSEHSYLNKLNL
jgi:hypothetical protein